MHGRVVDAQGAPLAKASIRCGDYGSSTSALTSSGADGSFRLLGLPSGTLELQALGPAGGTQRQSFTLRPGDDVEWAVQIVTRPGVAGRVLDAAGAPAAGFLVGAIVSGHPGQFRRSAKSDAQGRFVLGDWPPDADAVEVREPGDWLGLPAACIESVHPGGPELEIRSASTRCARPGSPGGSSARTGGRSWRARSAACGGDPAGPERRQRRRRPLPLRAAAPRDLPAPARDPGLRPDTDSRDRARRARGARGRRSAPGGAGRTARAAAPAREPPPGGGRRVRQPDGRGSATEIRGGQGRLGGLAPGRYRLQFANDRLRAAPVEVELRAHATEEVTELRRAGPRAWCDWCSRPARRRAPSICACATRRATCSSSSR